MSNPTRQDVIDFVLQELSTEELKSNTRALAWIFAGILCFIIALFWTSDVWLLVVAILGLTGMSILFGGQAMLLSIRIAFKQAKTGKGLE